jgi:hypothetical protein
MRGRNPMNERTTRRRAAPRRDALTWRAAASLLLCLVTSGCTDLGQFIEETPPTVCGEGVTGASFCRDIQPILTANCAKSGCHLGTAALGAADLDLEAGHAYANIVGVRSVSARPIKRVVPAYPDSSLLYLKLLPGTPYIPRMPQSLPPLLQADINLIRQWITAGALNN